MKKSLFFMMLLMIVTLASCSDDDNNFTPIVTSDISFNISEYDTDAPSTRVAVINRYIVEIYKESDPNIVIKRVEQASGSIVVNLEVGTNYICLFWADGVVPQNDLPGDGTFDASNLKNVTLNTGKEMADAFFHRENITDDTKTFNITLGRATAQVRAVATDVVAANTDLKITYDRYNSFNTFDSSVTGAKVSTPITFNSTATTGILGTFLTFASTVGIISDFTVDYNASIINTILNVPLKVNYITNLRGNYSTGSQEFTIIITVDDNWGSIVGGVDINVGTIDVPKWIRVADRNAEKEVIKNGVTISGVNGATAGATATDYGYYYEGNLADESDHSDIQKAHSACYNFAEGEGLWRLPTQVEMIKIVGSTASHGIDHNRKIKWANGPDWKLYNERLGQEANFVIFQLGGFADGSGNGTDLLGGDDVGATMENPPFMVSSIGTYWTSDAAFRMAINTNGLSDVTDYGLDGGYMVRCVRDM